VSTWNVIVLGTYIHTNPAPGLCQCFSLFGGGIGVDRTITKHWDAALRGNYGRAGNALYAQNFAFATFEAGPKYNFFTTRRDSYFAEALAGGVKPTSNFVANNALALSATVAVGMNYSLNKHWTVRVFEGGVDYTTEPNGGSNSQYNIRGGAGVVYKLGRY
jgi:hypothetical protein